MENIVTLEMDAPIWERFFTVSPLVLIGSRDESGSYNLAPKHMAFPMGWDNYYGFVCSPNHATYQNIRRESVFTVSYPRPTQVVLTSLAAAPRNEDDSKLSLLALSTFEAEKIDGRFVTDGYLYFECILDRILDDFGRNSLVTGRIVAAHVHQDALRVSEQEDHDLLQRSPLLAYLEPGRFSRIKDTHPFPFPADFKR